MTLEIVIDCVFGGKRYLDAEAMEPLWKNVNLAVNNYFIGDLFLGTTVSFITITSYINIYCNISIVKYNNTISLEF